ncbi:MAG: hypothetical protein ABL895_13870 [Cyclobacteriaceae bacterium]
MKLKLQCNTEPALWHMHVVVCSCPSPTLNEPHGLAGFGLREGCVACKLVWREVISFFSDC